MTDILKNALEEADKVFETFGLNVRGNSLHLIEMAIDGSDIEPAIDKDSESINVYPADTKIDVSDVYDLWDDIGTDIIRQDMQGTDGHMSRRDTAILEESCRELIPVVLIECNTWKEIVEVLSIFSYPDKESS